MTKIEDATNEQLDRAAAEKVMGWELLTVGYYGDAETETARQIELEKWIDACGIVDVGDYFIDVSTNFYVPIYNFSPTTNIAHAFEVDRPEWEWDFEELVLYDRTPDGLLALEITLYDTTIYLRQLADIYIPLDPANKTLAYCRGRVLCALKACGVEEI